MPSHGRGSISSETVCMYVCNLLTVVGRIVATQRRLCPHVGAYRNVVMWHRGIKVADGIKISNELTLKLGDYPE